jgi:hypothetical protein
MVVFRWAGKEEFLRVRSLLLILLKNPIEILMILRVAIVQAITTQEI